MLVCVSSVDTDNVRTTCPLRFSVRTTDLGHSGPVLVRIVKTWSALKEGVEKREREREKYTKKIDSAD